MSSSCGTVYPGTGSPTVIRGYDNAGRWTSVQDWNTNTTTFCYDAGSNLTTETFPTGSGVVDTFTFNAADQTTVYWASWEYQRHVIDNLSEQVPAVAPFLLPARATLWVCQRVGLSMDEGIDNIKSPLEQELGIGSEPSGDEGFVGNIGPHQTGPKTYLQGKHANGDEDLAW